ncbi:hypothetical protein BU64_30280 [Escherichia coli O128:H2 str. 2011C-3317]|nr:hypothetical protein BU64_30280 [Escherichia coli O128:H2 str. 2011C-3317]
MIQGGDYLLKENEELGGENDHKMIILLTFYPVKVGIARICSMFQINRILHKRETQHSWNYAGPI